MGNWKTAIDERISKLRSEQRKINEEAAWEYLDRGNTRRFRRMWRVVCSLDLEIERLEVLVGARSEPRKIGFISNEVPIPNDYDAPLDTEDDDEDELFDDEEDAPRGIEIYCSRKEPRRW